MPKKLSKWPPPRTKPSKKHGVRVMSEGEPNTLELLRFDTDMALRTSVDNACCDCGLRHLLVFEVFRDHTGRFFLNKRAYRIDK